MDSAFAIRVSHLSKNYKIFEKPVDRLKESLNPFGRRYSRDFHALDDITFDVRAGETVGIMGKNGAGKSTLLKLITGVLTPTSGTLEVHGSVASLLELGAGFNPEMTGIENIYLNGTIMGRSRAEMDARLEDIVGFADIGDFVRQPVKTYSSGMFARLAFAVNAFVEPDILIVDEALSVGDNFFQVKCMRKMRDLMEGGTSVLFVSHDINAIRRFCTKAIWLEQGHLKAIGETNRVADAYENTLQDSVETLDAEKEKPAQPEERNLRKIAAEIESVALKTVDGRPLPEEIAFDEPFRVTVTYDVKNPAIERPVLGIAIRSFNEDYVCGLNTLLDEIAIPWQKGRNTVHLAYPAGMRVPNGKYYFDVALFEETATIPFHYMTKAAAIKMKPCYKGEGMAILPHDWQFGNGPEKGRDHGKI